MEQCELPVGWERGTLAEAATWGSGGTPSRKNPEYYGGTIPWVKTGELGPRILTETEETITELGLAHSSAKVFPAGSIAVAMYGATIGKVSILGIAAATNQACAVAIADPLFVHTEFLFHYLFAQRDEFANAGKGGAQPNISQGLIKDWPLPLPPLGEQRRIAAKLDTTLGAVEACRQRLDGVAEILKRFRQAVLAAATSGELTREWRENNPSTHDTSRDNKVLENHSPDSPVSALPESWTLSRGADIVEKGADIVYGIVQPGPKLQEGVPYIRGTDILCGKILEGQLLRTSQAIAARYKRSELRAGDVLLGIIRATKVAIVPPSLTGANITQGTARFRPSSRIRSKFLAIALESPSIQQWLHDHYRGIDMPGLNLADVRRVPIPLPSLREQDEIISRFSAMTALADQLEARLTSARKIVDRLTPALLAKAFRGELVPQDPSDEPASVLLERIRAARQEEAGAGKPSRRGRRKVAANTDQIPLDAAPVPSDLLSGLLQECGALSERALLAASELEPGRFRRQLELEMKAGRIREELEEGGEGVGRRWVSVTPPVSVSTRASPAP